MAHFDLFVDFQKRFVKDCQAVIIHLHGRRSNAMPDLAKPYHTIAKPCLTMPITLSYDFTDPHHTRLTLSNSLHPTEIPQNHKKSQKIKMLHRNNFLSLKLKS